MVGFPGGSAVVAAARARTDPDVWLALHRAYGLDVDTLDIERLGHALARLPAGAWPDPHHEASWTVGDYLLANLIDAVHELIAVTAQANSKTKVERPKPVWRPGQRATASAGRKVRWADLAKALTRGAD